MMSRPPRLAQPSDGAEPNTLSYLLQRRWLQLALGAALFLLPLVGLPIAYSQPSGRQALALREQPVQRLQAVASEAGLVLYAQTTGGLLRSLDGGATFARADAGLPRAALGHIRLRAWTVAPGEPWRLYAAAVTDGALQDAAAQLFRSDDGGDTWRPLEGALADRLRSQTEGGDAPATPGVDGDSLRLAQASLRGLAVAPSAPDMLYLAGPQRLWRSSDAGRAWSAAAPWPGPLQGAAPLLLVVDGREPQQLLASAGAGVWQSRDAGQTWQLAGDLPPLAEISSLVAAPDRSGLAYAGSRTLVYRTVDGGMTWRGAALPAAADLVGALFVDPLVGETVYAADSAGQLFRSDDAGSSWRLIDGAGRRAGPLLALAIDPSQRDQLFLASNDGIWRRPVAPLLPTVTPTPTASQTPTPAPEPTPTASQTPTSTPSATSTPTASQTPSATASPTATATRPRPTRLRPSETPATPPAASATFSPTPSLPSEPPPPTGDGGAATPAPSPTQAATLPPATETPAPTAPATPPPR